MNRVLTVAGALCLLAGNAPLARAQKIQASQVRTFPIPLEGREIDFSPDSKLLASSSPDTVLRIFSVSDGRLVAALKHPVGLTSVAFSSDGQHLATASYDEMVRIWNVRTGVMERVLKGSRGTVWAVTYSPDGKLVASSGEDSTAKIWDAATGALLHTLRGHTRNVWSVGFSPDGATLATGSFDATAKLWRVGDGSLIRTLTGHTQAVVHVGFSPGGMLATSGDDKTVKFWNSATGSLIRSIDIGNHTYSFDFTPDGKWMVTGGRGRSAAATFWHQIAGEKFTPGLNQGLKLWRVSDGSLVQTVTGHTDDIWDVRLSPDGRWLASSSLDKSVKLWRVLVR